MSIIGLVMRLMEHSGAIVESHLEKITKKPEQVQKDLLFSILKKAKNTEFGKKHHFEKIKTIEDYRKSVPLTDYDFFSPYIEKIAEGKNKVLTPYKVVHFNETSGTLGNPKMIPVTEKHVKSFSTYHGKFITHLICKNVGTAWMKGKGLNLTEGTYKILPSGITFGSASSLTASRMGKLLPFLKNTFNSLYTSPTEARQPKKGTPTRYLHTRFALMEKNITYASATFTSYLHEIMRYMEDNWQMLVEDIRNGTISSQVNMPTEVENSILKKIKPMPERADELEAIFKGGFETPIVKKIWPNMTYVVSVGGAGFSIYSEKLKKRYFGEDIPFVFLGLSASEGFFSIPTAVNNYNAVFTPNTVFMEFIPIEEPDKILLLHELQVGKEYETVLTSSSGLYRYKMKDVVRVTGMHNNTPTMQFLHRSGYAINMFGEKTSDLALQETAVNTAKELGLDLYDYAVYPDPDSAPGRYVFFLELRNYDGKISRKQMRDTAEKYLFLANPDIAESTKDGLYGKMDLKLLQPETFLFYRDLMIAKGRSASQLKPVHVLNTPYLKNFFYTLEEPE